MSTVREQLAQLVAGDVTRRLQLGSDGVLDDPDTRRQDMAMGLSLLNASIIGPVEYRMRYFGEDEKTARPECCQIWRI